MALVSRAIASAAPSSVLLEARSKIRSVGVMFCSMDWVPDINANVEEDDEDVVCFAWCGGWQEQW